MALGFAITMGLAQTAPLTILGSAQVGATLSLSAVKLTGSSPMAYSVQWYRNGLAISGATQASYVTGTVDEGTTITAVLTLPGGGTATSTNAVIVPTAPLAGPSPLSVADFTADRIVFDSGSAFGQARADIPLSGTADANAQIEARAVPQGGGTATAWSVIATADGAGQWSGALGAVPRSTRWYLPEVRQAAAPASTVAAQTRFAVGHRIDIWGQSELHRMVLSSYAALGAVEAVSDPETLTVTYSSDFTATGYGTPANWVTTKITNATPVSAHMTRLSNLLSAAAPGEKFHVVFQTLSGTGMTAMLNDSVAARMWSADLGLHGFAAADGQSTGLAWTSWYNADAGTLNSNYGTYLFTALTGLNPDGSAFALGGTVAGQTLDHVFPTLYTTAPKWIIAGPHRFEDNTFDGTIAACRASVNAMMANPYLPATVERGIEPLSYLNGNPSYGGDTQHPNTTNNPQDGMMRLVATMANDVLRGLGLLSVTIPEFDTAALAPDSTYVEVWSSAGNIITTRSARAESVPAGYPAVYGFKWDGVLATEVQIVSGRVRVYLNAAHDPIPSGTILTFGDDSIGTADPANELSAGAAREVWKDHPLVNAGQVGLEGLPIRGQTPQSVLGVIPTSTIPADPNTNPDLLPTAVSSFTAAASAPGWTIAGSWTLGGDGTATIGAITNSSIFSDTGNQGTTYQNKHLELSFVLSSPDAGAGPLLMTVYAAGGGQTTLYSAEFTPTVGARTTIDLGTFPATRNALRIDIRRRPAATGTFVLSQFTVKQI